MPLEEVVEEASADAAPGGCRTGSDTAHVLLLLLGLLLPAGWACAECTLGVFGLFGACPDVSRRLLSAGLAALVGFAPMLASVVASAGRLNEDADKRRRSHLARCQLAELDGLIEEAPAPAAVTTVTATGTATTSQQEDGVTALSDIFGVANAGGGGNDYGDGHESTLDHDINSWLTLQCEQSQLELVQNAVIEMETRSMLNTVRRFLAGVYEFYRPGTSRAERRRRQYVTCLLCLPVSCAYALPLFNLLFVAPVDDLPAGCARTIGLEPGTPWWSGGGGALGTVCRLAVALRLAAIVVAIVACVAVSCYSVLTRRLRDHLQALRLRPQKPRLFSVMFG